MEESDNFEIRQARKDLELAIANADLAKQLEKIGTDDELYALGWRVLNSVHYEKCWQQCGWVWIQPTNRGWIENIALFSGEPNGYCSFIKLLSVKEFKALIVKEAEDP